MGSRALVGVTLPNGHIEVFYSHWGAGGAPDVIPSEPNEERWLIDNLVSFGRSVNYLSHEAVWLDERCYIPIWTFPAEFFPVEQWETQGYGILVPVYDKDEVCHLRSLSNLFHYTQQTLKAATPKGCFDLPFPVRALTAMLINICIGELTTSNEIPFFSPQGYKVSYTPHAQFVASLNFLDYEGFSLVQQDLRRQVQEMVARIFPLPC